MVRHWGRRRRRVLGLDLGAHSIKLVVLDPRAAEDPSRVILDEVDLPRGAMNGLVIEAFDEVVDLLTNAVAQGGWAQCPVALALPSPSVREWAGPLGGDALGALEPDTLPPLVREQMQLPAGEWCVDYGTASASQANDAWAVVARASVVQDRYELAEMAGLQPLVLDVDRLALDRLLERVCQRQQQWPSLWLVVREGQISVHLALGAAAVVSAAAYVVPDVPLPTQCLSLLMNRCAGHRLVNAASMAVSIRFSGVDEPLRESIMAALHPSWPMLYESTPPEAVWLALGGEAASHGLALALALHPHLR